MFFYGSSFLHTTNGSANTESDAIRYLTVSPRPCNITRIVLGTSGAPTLDAQIFFDVRRMSTASTAGSAFVPEKSEPANQAAVSTPFTGPTKGTPNTNPLLYLALNQRGTWQWSTVPGSDEQIALITGGGANGNIDLLSNASAISVPVRVTIAHWE